MYRILYSLRTDDQTKNRNIVVICDNVSFRSQAKVREMFEAMKVSVCFNAKYSPDLNPIEQFFNLSKREMRKMGTVASKSYFVSKLKDFTLQIN